ncbi:hypothetical protein [Sandaracinus amylolyticus]|nr:hypothetical protein [Sandaracinus amylolyticus]
MPERDAPPDPGKQQPLLFCPFCRECFEGERECPEHELALVPFDQLPRDPELEGSDLPSHDEPVSMFEPRFGRGLVMAGVALSAIGFALPLLTITTATQTRTFSGFETATGPAPSVWTIPFVAAMFVWILARRRTPLEMLGARLVGVVFALAPLVSLVYTVLKVTKSAEEQSAQTGRLLEVGVEYGAGVLAIAALLLLAGSARLGVIPIPRGGPSSPEPASEQPKTKR